MPGRTRELSIARPPRCFSSMTKCLMTERLTAENAMSAPKLTISEMKVRSTASASSETTATASVARTGVWKRGESRPKKPFGSTPSRPMAKRMRETDACEVRAEPQAPAT